jgi:hypothetical protein
MSFPCRRGPTRDSIVGAGGGIVAVGKGVDAGAAAVYVEAQAEQVDPDGRTAALAVFNARAQEQGIGSWSERDVSAAAQFRIYRARASRV